MRQGSGQYFFKPGDFSCCTAGQIDQNPKHFALKYFYLNLLRSVFFAALNRVINFAAVNGHFARSFDSQADLVASYLNDDNLDVVVDDDALIFLPR